MRRFFIAALFCQFQFPFEEKQAENSLRNLRCLRHGTRFHRFAIAPKIHKKVTNDFYKINSQLGAVVFLLSASSFCFPIIAFDFYRNFSGEFFLFSFNFLHKQKTCLEEKWKISNRRLDNGTKLLFYAKRIIFGTFD